MVSLEQVKLLETKVVKAIEHVKRLSGENSLLREKLDGYRNRIDELEVLIQRFKEDQGRIEEGILSALTKLNQFEDSMEQAIIGETPPRGEQPHGQVAASAGRVEKSASGEEPDGRSDGGSDDAILAALEAEEAEARRQSAADELSMDTGTEPQDAAAPAPAKAQAAELDIF